ncbi:MAG: conjugal transfer protein TrbL family protein [Sulfobacillus sp.]
MNIIAGAVQPVLQSVLGVLAPLVATTPDVWLLPIVSSLWHFSLSLVGVCALLLVLLTASQMISGIRVDWLRLVISLGSTLILALLSMRICIFLIHLNNALIASLAAQVALQLTPVSLPTRVLADLVFWLPYLVLLLILTVVYLIRAIELMFLATISPLGLMALAWPVSRPIGGRYLQELVVITLVQTVQAFVLVLSRGLSGLEGLGPANALVGLAALYLMIRAPALLRAMVTGARRDAPAWMLAAQWLNF